MKTAKLIAFWFITLIIATTLTVLPLPTLVQWLWPQWLLLVLFFLLVASSHSINVPTALLIGLLSDAVSNIPLGVHGLLFSLTAGFLLFCKRQLDYQNKTVQWTLLAITVLLNLVLSYGLLHWVSSTVFSAYYWLSFFTSLLVWPIIFWLLTWLEKQLREPANTDITT